MATFDTNSVYYDSDMEKEENNKILEYNNVFKW
jgi:hypothetical protein